MCRLVSILESNQVEINTCHHASEVITQVCGVMVRRAKAPFVLADEGLLDPAAKKSKGGSSQERDWCKQLFSLIYLIVLCVEKCEECVIHESLNHAPIIYFYKIQQVYRSL